VVYWKTEDEQKEDLETGEIISDRRVFPCFNSVFNLDQTTGIDIEMYKSEIAPNNNNPLELCEMVVSNMPNPPLIEHKQLRAYYRPSKDIVNVPEIRFFDNSEAYYSTMFHELAHSTGHPDRLKRFEDNKSEFSVNSYDFEELVAEMAATFLCAHCGIEQTFDNSIAYLSGWANFLKEERKMTLFGAAAKAQAAVNYILGKQNQVEQSENV